MGFTCTIDDEDWVSYNCQTFMELCDCMDWLGMLQESDPPPEFCLIPIDPEKWCGALSWHPSPCLGIAAHKLTSNDQWVVTAEECRAAFDALESKWPPPMHAGLGRGSHMRGADQLGGVFEFFMEHSAWAYWLDFLKRGADHGFCVS